MTAIERLHDWLRPSSIIAATLGAVLGLMLSYSAGAWLQAIDYALWPVSQARVVGVHRDGDEVHFRLFVTRLRPECSLVGAYAYGITPEGFPVRANASRIDGNAPRDVPLGIELDVGEWRAWPVAGAREMVIYVHHTCGDRLVSTKLVGVPT